MSSPIIIRPQLIGNWQKALAQDQVVGQNLSGANLNNDPTALTAFQQSPATGMATIINQARQGYNPLDPTSAANYAAYNNWIERILATGYFNLELNDNPKVGGTNNWQAYISQTISLYEGINAADINRVTNTIVNLINISYSVPGQPETVIMAQQTIQDNPDQQQVSAFFFYTTAMIVYNKGGKHSSSTVGTYFSVIRKKITLTYAQWNAIHTQVADRQVNLVQNWLNGTNSQAQAMYDVGISPADKNLTCLIQVPSLPDARRKAIPKDYWYSFEWQNLPDDARKLFNQFGIESQQWHALSVTGKAPLSIKWSELNDSQRSAATKLAYSQLLWDGPGVIESLAAADRSAYWGSYEWEQMAPAYQQRWRVLGYGPDNWPPTPLQLTGKSRGKEQRNAADWLGIASAKSAG